MSRYRCYPNPFRSYSAPYSFLAGLVCGSIGSFSCMMPAAVSSPPAITSPVPNQLSMPGVPVTVTATVPIGTLSALVQLGLHAPITMSIVGSVATAIVTPDVTDVGASDPVLVTANGLAASTTINVKAGGAYWLDFSDSGCYTVSGANITGLRSKVSGTLISTVTGSPTLVTSPRNGKPALNLPGGALPSYVRGADAPAIAAVVGTNKPFTVFYAINVLECVTTGICLSVADAASATKGQEFGQTSTPSPGYLHTDKQGTAYKPASAIKTPAGNVVVCHRSVDGLTVFTSVNGGAEVSTVLTTAGAVTATQVCVGAAGHTTPTLPYGGYLYETVLFDTGLSSAECSGISNTLLDKWGEPVAVQFIGDSITTAQLATNGGMAVLLAAAVRAVGGTIDLQGPIAYANGSGGQVWYPHRYSAASGSTCTTMNARVNNSTQGLGSGAGHYLNTDLVCLMAGTNMETDAPTSLAAYSTLLNSVYTALTQGTKPPKILVTTICEITSNLAYSQAFNAGLPAIWSAFAALHPGVLEYWDANDANPNDGTNTFFIDGTHPNDAGYLRLCDNPTSGLIQAALPIIMSLQ